MSISGNEIWSLCFSERCVKIQTILHSKMTRGVQYNDAHWYRKMTRAVQYNDARGTVK